MEIHAICLIGCVLLIQYSKFHCVACHEGTEREIWLCSFFSLGAKWGRVVNATHWLLIPGNDPVHIVMWAGIAPSV
jgi:hypothetical protein